MSSFKFRPGVVIGSLSAEDDKYLSEAFIEKEELKHVLDPEDAKCVLLGRTGTGKSAILRHIEENEDEVKRINPEYLSLQFLSNSTILKYFTSIGVNLDLFYKLLWKHVFIVEALKMYFKGEGNTPSNKLVEFFQRINKSKEYKEGLDYLKKYENDFWNKCENRIKEMEKKVTEGFAAKLKIGVSDLGSFFEDHSTKEKVEKYEIINKAESVIKESQLVEINQVIDALRSELFKKSQRKFFIVIDDLDKDWVDPKIVNALIKGLVLTIYELRSLKGLKIIIALRSNIIELAFMNDSTRGIQREKYFHIISNLQWSKGELKELVNKRLAVIMKDQYTNATPTVEDVFPKESDRRKGGFDEILDKTFLRPRDVIDFVNKCIENAQGSTKITRDAIKKADYAYSKNRFKAVIDEWSENYGNLTCLVNALKNKAEPIFIKDFQTSDFNEFVIKCAQKNHGFSGEIQSWYRYYNDSHDLEYLVKNVLALLYKVGFIGVKIDSQAPTVYSYQSDLEFSAEDLNAGMKFYVHPTFAAYLRTKTAYSL